MILREMVSDGQTSGGTSTLYFLDEHYNATQSCDNGESRMPLCASFGLMI